MDQYPTSTRQTTFQIALTNKRVLAYCLYACLAAIPLGFEASTLLSLPQFRRLFGHEYQGEYVVSAARQAIWNSVLVFGGVFGAAIAGPIGSRLGRKYIFIVASVVETLGMLQLQIAQDWKVIASGKLFNYTAKSLYAVGASTYISEIALPGIRGMMLSFINLFIYIGQFINSCVLRGTQDMSSNLSFRIPIMFQFVIPFIFLACTWMVPESPFWLVEKGKTDAAIESLTKLHGGKGDLHHRLQEIETIINQQRKGSSARYIDCFKGSNLRRTFIATGLLSGQQIIGAAFIFGYITYFLILSGIEQAEAFTLATVMYSLQIVANILSWSLIERYGRRFLLLSGTTVILVSHCIIGGVGISNRYNVGPLPKVVVSFMVIISVVYQLSLGSAGWAAASEVSSAATRALTQSIALAVSIFFGFLIFFTIPYLINPDQANLGPKVCFIYAFLTFLTLLFIYFAVPEMKCRTYEELEYMFEHGLPARDFQEFSIPPRDAEFSSGNNNPLGTEKVDV